MITYPSLNNQLFCPLRRYHKEREKQYTVDYLFSYIVLY
jgi:hypothetical protein